MPARMRRGGVHSGREKCRQRHGPLSGKTILERKRTMENKKKKRYGIVAALLLLVLAAGVGTYAWLTATQDLENVFTVGSFGTPDKKPDPTDPEKPGTDPNENGAYLFETKWVADSKIIPGDSAAKNPNVGIKAGSDNAYVFIYVKNAMVKDGTAPANTPYFTLTDDNWKPVAADQVVTSADGKYLSGLFMYAKGATSGPAILSAKDATADVYTGELFSKVMFPGTLEGKMVAESPKMTVSAYIFGADQQGEEATPAANAVAQAKVWAQTKR